VSYLKFIAYTINISSRFPFVKKTLKENIAKQ
jgi:hypothetical protein